MTRTGQVALVTGSARRVGRAIALALGREGMDVAVHYNRSREQAEQTARLVRECGAEAETVAADLAAPDRIAELFGTVEYRFGRLDVLVNNAAVFHRTPLEALTAEQWDAEMAVNARAAALCIRFAVPLMRPRGGAIINITDVAAERAWAGFPAYCASKAALLAVTKSAARALAGDNIRVNAVAPGAILWEQGAWEPDKAQVLAQVPLGREGRPEDVAAAVAFLARQDYITGQTIRVDGGWHMG